jgi:putative FmdB family regulatory protein
MGRSGTLMILYDWECECGNAFEAFASICDRTHICERCGEKADRLISTPMIKLEGHSGDFPTAHRKWVKTHEQEAKKTTS